MAEWLVDLDGVVWRGEAPVTGAADAVAALRRGGDQVWFCTNNSSATVSDHEAKLARHGLAGDGLLTSAMAVATLVAPGERVVACAGGGAVEALESAGATIVEDGPADVVVVGFHRHVDLSGLTRAVRAVLAGARLVATNDDPLYPDADGPTPGGGAVLAAVERATGRRAEVAGKPNPAMVALVGDRVGSGGWVVGDSQGTDGRLAAALGLPFALVLSGGTTRADIRPPAPDLVAEDLAEVVATLRPDLRP